MDTEVLFRFIHDLRSNLRTVLTRIQLFAQSESPEKRAPLQEAISAADEMNGLLNAMTAYLSGNVEEGSVNLRLLIRGLLLESKAQVEVAGDLDTSVPAGMKTVLKELLANARKFQSLQRPLRIRIEARNGELQIADNGIGVEPPYTEKIFAPFFTLHSRTQFPGYGLGLATCRCIVESWGGTITAFPGPETGLVVCVTYPQV